MKKNVGTKIRRLNIATHRDLGYFFSSLIITYCLSGLALNHINEWNPDFIIEKQKIEIDPAFAARKKKQRHDFGTEPNRK